jgi:hypothetical protein
METFAEPQSSTTVAVRSSSVPLLSVRTVTETELPAFPLSGVTVHQLPGVLDSTCAVQSAVAENMTLISLPVSGKTKSDWLPLNSPMDGVVVWGSGSGFGGSSFGVQLHNRVKKSSHTHKNLSRIC